MWYYDKKSHGFKCTKIHGDLSKDENCIEISDEHYQYLQEKESQGIAGYKVDEDGNVDVVDIIIDIDTLKSQMKREMKKLIYSKFDQGTQSTLQAIYLATSIDPDKQTIEEVWEWINSILKYYYEKRIYLETNGAENFEYDFSQFAHTAPSINIEDLL